MCVAYLCVCACVCVCVYECVHVCTRTSNGLGAADAFLGKQFTKTVGAVRFLITRSELLTCQHLVTVSTGEAFTVPRCALVSDATLIDHLHTDRMKIYLKHTHTVK